MSHKFRIIAGLVANGCRVEMDGVEITDVVRVSFDLAADRITVMKLEIIGEVIVEGEFQETSILKVEQPVER